MRAKEFIIEFNQQKADQALRQAMLEVAGAIKNPRVKPGSPPFEANLINQLKSILHSSLYGKYLRNSFSDEKFSFSNKEYQAAIDGKFDHGFPSLNIVYDWNPSGHLQFTNVEKKRRNNQIRGNSTKKLYFTLDPKTGIEQIPNIFNSLLSYLSDKNNKTMQFKINYNNDINSESDFLVAYLEDDAKENEELNRIKKIFPSAPRGHRNEVGHDVQQLDYGQPASWTKEKESDSTVRYLRFVEYLVKSFEYYSNLLKEIGDEKVADILVKVWKDKFSNGELHDRPVPPEKLAKNNNTNTNTDANKNTAPASNIPQGTANGQVINNQITLISELNNKQLALKIPTTIGKNNLQGFGDDVRFLSDVQFNLVKSADGNWSISPNPTAVNKTMINGQAITGPTPLRKGMVITVGNPATKNQRMPIRVG